MAKSYKKAVLVAVKLVIATVLLGWVLSRSHWNDFVQDRLNGKTYAVVDAEPSVEAPSRLTVSRGIWWWREQTVRPVGDFVDEGKGLIRPGFAQSIRRLDWVFVVPAILCYPLSMLMIAIRWRYLLAVQEVRIGVWESLRLTFLGQFFNTVIPGTVGGDLVKAYYVARHTPKKAAVLISVFVDRVLGLAGLTALAVGMLALVLVLGLARLDDPGIRPAAVTCGVVVALVVGAMLFLLSPGFRRRLHLQKLYRRLPIAHHLEAAGEAATRYGRRPGTLLGALGLTFLAQMAWLGALMLLGKSLHLATPIYTYFLFLPLIYIIGSVPVTPGGVGLIEDLYLRFFSSVGQGPAVLAFALLGRLVPMFWGLPGLWVMVTGARPPKAEAIEAELGIERAPAD